MKLMMPMRHHSWMYRIYNTCFIKVEISMNFYVFQPFFKFFICFYLIFIFRFPNSFSDIFNAISFNDRTLSFWEKKIFTTSVYKNQNWWNKSVFPTKPHICGLLILNKLPALNFNMHIKNMITCIPFVIAIRKLRCPHNV